MKRLFKLFIGLCLLIVLIISTLAITIIYLDPDNYKQMITDKFREQTGRDMAIDGQINLIFYPWLGLDVGGIKIANAKGFGEEPFLETKTVRIRAKLLPLLRKKLEMDTLVLHGARLNLSKNAEGKTNWDDLIKKDTQPAEKSDQELPLTALVLGGIDIKDANIVWRDQQQGLEYKINNASLNTGELVLGKPIDIIASLNASASKPALSADLKFNGTATYEAGGDVLMLKPVLLEADFKGKHIPGGEAKLRLSVEINVDTDKEVAQINALELTAFNTELKGQIVATNILSGQPDVTGDIAVQGQNLPQLFRLAELEPLASQLARLSDKSFGLNTTFNVDMARSDVNLSKLNLSALGNTLNAEIYARNIESDTPAAKGSIKASGADLPVLIKIASQFMGDNQDIAALSKQLAGSPKGFEVETQFDADLKTGMADVPQLSIKALGMTTTGKLNAKQLNSDKPSVNGELKASGSDLALLIQIASSMSKDSELLKLARDLNRLKDKAFDLDARFNADMNSGKIDLPALSANAFGFKISGKLKGDNIQKGSGNMKGRFAVNSTDPQPLLKAIGQTNIAQLLQSIDLSIGISGNTTDLNLAPFSVNAIFAGKNIPHSLAKLTVQANSTVNLEKELFELNNFSVSGLGLNAKGSIKASQYKTDPALSGQITVAPFNLRQFMQTINIDLPKTADPEVFSHVGLSADFSASKGSIALKQMKVQLDESKVQGDLNIKSVSPLELEFGIGVDRLNADRYLPPQSKEKKRPATPETVATVVATEIPVDILRTLKITGDFAMGQFQISNARLSDLELSIQAAQGEIKLNPVNAKLYQGNYTGDILLDARGKEPRLTFNTKLTGVQAEPLLKDLQGKADLLGEANINLALNSSGATTDLLKARLSGKGDIKFNNGTLVGVDIPKALRQFEIMLESKRFGEFDTSGETNFSSLTGTLTINNGVVDNDDLLMDASGFKVTGKGMLINLDDANWKYNMNVMVDPGSVTSGEERYNTGGYDILIKCRDKIVDKKCLPDLESVIKTLLKDTAEEKIRGILQDAIGIKLPDSANSNNSSQQQGSLSEQQTEQQQTAPRDPAKEILDAAGKELFDKLF